MPYVGRDSIKGYREILAEQNAMWTDFYELTIAQALFGAGMHDEITTFQYFYRSAPFGGQPLFTAGQNILHEFFDKYFTFDELAVERLADQIVPGTDKRVFNIPGFLDLLKNMKNELTIEAMPEGTIAFPNQPIMRVTGPAYQCLIAEPAIMNAMNSQSLFVTLANMFRRACERDPMIEGGLRRAQSIGGIEPSRAGIIGGFDFTSNCQALYHYGAPVRGTMAHAYIMMFENELDAIDNWLEHSGHMPVFLIDTYDTIEGAKRVIDKCKERGVDLKGVRLDFGDLNHLSNAVRVLLDEAGYKNAAITASNDLDIETITSLRAQNAKIASWLIGTNFATSKDQPALGGVYKLASVFDKKLLHSDVLKLHSDVQDGVVSREQAMTMVREKMKLSEQQVKMTLPGSTDVIRTYDGAGKFGGDIIVPYLHEKFVDDNKLTRSLISVDPLNPVNSKEFAAGTAASLPLSRMFRNGALVGNIETIYGARDRVQEQVASIDDSHLRLLRPHRYVVGVEEDLLLRQGQMGRELKRQGFVTPKV